MLSVETDYNPSMLAPRFTLRTGLAWLTAGSLVAIVLREAMQETPWALGVAVALLTCGFSIALQACAFGLSLALSRGVEREDK